MRKEIYDYMQVSSVPLSRQKQLTVDYGKTDHLLKAHQLYTDNKKDYVANRAQDKKTIVDLSYNPGEVNEFQKKQGAVMTPTALSKSYFQSLHENNKTFKEENKTNIKWSQQQEHPSHKGNKHLNESA